MSLSHQFDNQLHLLSDAELLSTFLPYPAVKQLITEYQSIDELVLHTTPIELRKIKGLGKMATHKVICIKELLERLYCAKRKKMQQIHAPQDVADYMKDMEHLQQEEFHIIMLNTKNKVIFRQMIAKGTVSGALVSAREIFNPAIKRMATSVILVHNHPSSDTTPSQEDISMTKNVMQAGKIIGINVLDHIIIGKGQHLSMRESGYME